MGMMLGMMMTILQKMLETLINLNSIEIYFCYRLKSMSQVMVGQQLLQVNTYQNIRYSYINNLCSILIMNTSVTSFSQYITTMKMHKTILE